ncbi:methionyl-tRNA formyltransferase, mitochondrial isoform X2 [Cephus cinctus]|uniref:Methionyl-tRNA formyltransferase, mitochondrial n=1 Tax=Cephus cinctus TaxID=211228 RepID=A0AAJ7RRX9_CEPCN|nr:methionyl-tRNA formyltransferase, mitochondrial isoform X2 [Cephus cinctus]
MSLCRIIKQQSLRNVLLMRKIEEDLNIHKLISTIKVLPVFTQNNIHTSSNNGPWSVLFFGTDEFALESLKKLHAKYRSKKLLHRLEVVTAYKGKENAVQRYANLHSIPIHHWPLKINTSEFHIGLVVSFGHLIPSDIIHSFPLGMLNVHASLLPRWRGAAPIIYSLMHGDTQTGITIMNIMPKKFDVGAIIAQQKVDIHPDETMPELYKKLSCMGADLLVSTVEQLPKVLTFGKPQGDTAPKVSSKISLVKWSEMTAKDVYNLQRAITGLYPLTTKFQDITIKILNIKVLEKQTQAYSSSHSSPGSVIYDKKNDILAVCCRDNTWVSIEKLVVPGRQPMSARDFNNGFISKHKNFETYFQ